MVERWLRTHVVIVIKHKLRSKFACEDSGASLECTKCIVAHHYLLWIKVEQKSESRGSISAVNYDLFEIQWTRDMSHWCEPVPCYKSSITLSASLFMVSNIILNLLWIKLIANDCQGFETRDSESWGFPWMISTYCCRCSLRAFLIIMWFWFTPCGTCEFCLGNSST